VASAAKACCISACVVNGPTLRHCAAALAAVATGAGDGCDVARGNASCNKCSVGTPACVYAIGARARPAHSHHAAAARLSNSSSSTVRRRIMRRF